MGIRAILEGSLLLISDHYHEFENWLNYPELRKVIKWRLSANLRRLINVHQIADLRILLLPIK
jgi:hypothetical protein